MKLKDSRLSGFYRLSRPERVVQVAEWLGDDPRELLRAVESGGLPADLADRLVENVLGVIALPFSVAPNFVVNGRPVLVPMATEEPSVVAAAAHGAMMVREGGGFLAEVSPPVMTGQIFISGCGEDRLRLVVQENQERLLALAAQSDPVLCSLGGGPRRLEVRRLGDCAGQQLCAVHLHVDVRDAMGANVMNTMLERLAPVLEELSGGRTVMSILTNLSAERLVRVKARVPLAALSRSEPERVRDAVALASQIAEKDIHRAVTHNKGIMNGIDAVLLATANDWRAAEAGAHGWAALGGGYRPLCTWRVLSGGDLGGELILPLAVGVVGGSTSVHPLAQIARRIAGAGSAVELAAIAAACGMANNLAALRALVTEGIQAGHMRLHRRGRSSKEGR
jgi:hydroxymethylglutaryl-CoA reductase